jgi:hypothetical protein
VLAVSAHDDGNYAKGGMNSKKGLFGPAWEESLSTERRPRRVRRLEIALQLAWSVCKRARRMEKGRSTRRSLEGAPYSI